jgi:hypothetical protein
MNQRFGNVAYSYRNSRGKPVFAPSEDGRRIGYQLKKLVEANFTPDPFYFHLLKGGHVAAIHAHRSKRYFARLDLENYFYSIGRNRIARILQELGLNRAEHFSKWSTVKNPFDDPSYALPYGFVQSPLLASVVMAASGLGQLLRDLQCQVVVSVYVDDIALSSNNLRTLERAFRKLRRLAVASNFKINEAKSVSPGLTIELFNCHLARMQTLVTDARQAEFHSEPRTPKSVAAFEAYCAAVARGNQ